VIRQSFGSVNYIRLAKGKIPGSFRLHPVAHLNNGYASGKYIPADIRSPISLGLSVLELKDAGKGKIPENKTSALPWFPDSRDFQAVFVGINIKK
jgi:hypothetical protein